MVGRSDAVRECFEERETEFLVFVAVQLHGSESGVLDDLADCVHGFVDEHADLLARAAEPGR